MRLTIRLALIAVLVMGGLAIAAPASAAPVDDAVSTFTYTRNMHPRGFSSNTDTINSDLAFWGDLAVQGNFVGFRLIDISRPSRPRQLLDYQDCAATRATC